MTELDGTVPQTVRIWTISANPPYHLRSPEADPQAQETPVIDQFCAVGHKP